MKRIWPTLILGVLLLSTISQPTVAQDKQGTRRVTLAYVNDIHAQIEPHPELFWNGLEEEYVEEVGGLGRLSTAVKELKKERDGKVLFLDGGDTIQGSGPAAWSKGVSLIGPMNALALDGAVPGNWAVVYGPEILKQRVAEFNYPWIAANVYETGSSKPLLAPYLIREIDGIKIGVLGYTDPDIPTRQPPFMSTGLTFKNSSVLQPFIKELKTKEQVDIVILLTHIGLPKSVKLAKQLQGVDILLSADTHERTYDPIVVDETWVVEAGAFASFLGVLDIEIAPDGELTRRWELKELRPRSYPQDPAVRGAVEESLEPYRDRMTKVVGESDVWLSRYDVLSTPIDRIVADAIRDFSRTDIALSNGFRFAPPLAPGPITEADLWNWLPIEAPLKKGQVRGQELVDFWERELESVFSDDPDLLFGGWLPRPSNMNVLFDLAAQPGERLRQLSVHGEPVKVEKFYSVAAARRTGSPEEHVHRVKQCLHTEAIEGTTHQALRAYLAKNSPIGSTGKAPVRSLHGPPTMRSQFGGKDLLAASEDRPVHPINKGQPVKVVYQIATDELKDGVHKGLLYLNKLHHFYAEKGYSPEELHIHAVFHGKAAAHLLTDAAWRKYGLGKANPSTDLIASLVKSGVHLELCDKRRQAEHWSKSDVSPDVLLVEAAYPRLIELQQQGFSYIRF